MASAFDPVDGRVVGYDAAAQELHQDHPASGRVEGQREDFSVDVEGYGKGHMSFRIWN